MNKGVEHFPNTEMVFKMANRTSNGPTVLVKEPYNTALFIGDLAPSVTQATVTEACAALPGFMFVVFKAGAASHIPGHATVYFEDSIDTQRAYNQLVCEPLPQLLSIADLRLAWPYGHSRSSSPRRVR